MCVCVCVCVCVFIYPTPSPRARCVTRSILKRGATGLNSEFSFSWTSCLTKSDLLLTHSRGE